MSRASLHKTIFYACRELGLDDDARHDLQIQACGKSSMKDMTTTDMERVVEHLKDHGWKPSFNKKKPGSYHKRAPRADLRLIHVLWKLLGDHGCLRQPNRTGLNAFIRSRFENIWGSVPLDVDVLRSHSQISQVINALVDWCEREEVPLDASKLLRIKKDK